MLTLNLLQAKGGHIYFLFTFTNDIDRDPKYSIIISSLCSANYA